MTQEEIIRMAREADVPFETETDGSLYGMIGRMCNEDFFKFAAIVVAHEREAIAQMFDDSPKLISSAQNNEGGCLICGFTPKIAAAAIRARGEK